MEANLINEKIATLVMGWHLDDAEQIEWIDGSGHYVMDYDPRHSAITDGDVFDPMHRIEHAILAAETFYGYIIEKVGKGYRCSIQKTAREQWLCALKDSDTAPEAICLAALKAKEEENE